MLSRWVSPLLSSFVKGLLTVLVGGLALSPALSAQALNQSAAREKIIQYVRQRFNIPDTVKLSVSEFRESAYTDFYQTLVTVDDGKEKKSQPFFVSKDGRYLVEGNIFMLGGDPRKEIIRLISMDEQPAQGPAGAPVTIVEYSDLECPVCAKMHELLETDIIPKYGDKVRVVFKEFPLAEIHDWALAAAVATQCAYQIDPSKFAAFRSVIYKNQSTLAAAHIRDLLLHLGAQAELDNVKLAACIDSQSSLPRVEANLHEGQALGVSSTPTTFVNGRILVGTPLPGDFYKLIEEAMHDGK